MNGSASPPVALVLHEGADDLPAAETALTLALDGAPVVAREVRDTDDARAVAAALAGQPVVAARCCDASGWSRVVRGLRDLADLRSWDQTGLAGLDDVQLRLLVAVADGAPVTSAARAAATSDRAAFRALATARTTLRSDSNAQAAARVSEALAQLSGLVAPDRHGSGTD